MEQQVIDEVEDLLLVPGLLPPLRQLRLQVALH